MCCRSSRELRSFPRNPRLSSRRSSPCIVSRRLAAGECLQGSAHSLGVVLRQSFSLEFGCNGGGDRCRQQVIIVANRDTHLRTRLRSTNPGAQFADTTVWTQFAFKNFSTELGYFSLIAPVVTSPVLRGGGSCKSHTCASRTVITKILGASEWPGTFSSCAFRISLVHPFFRAGNCPHASCT